MANTFKTCDCGNELLHGHFFIEGVRLGPIFSLKDGRDLLALAESNGNISGDEKEQLLQELNSTSISEEGPSEEEVAAEQGRSMDEDALIENFLSQLGLTRDDVVFMPVADLIDPND